MSSSAKKIVGVLVVLLVAAAAGGYFIFVPQMEKQYEEQVRKVIQSIPGDLKADAVKANFFKKEVVVTNLNGTTKYYDGTDMQISVGSIALSGINLSAGSANAVERLADGLAVENVKFHIEPEVIPGEPMAQDITAKSISAKNIQGNLMATVALQGTEYTNKQLVDALASYSMEDLKFMDYRTNAATMVGAVSSSIESLTAKKTSLLSAEDSEWKNTQVMMFGKNILSIDRVTTAKTIVPDVLTPMMDAADRGEMDENAVMSAFGMALEDKPMVMEGFVMEGLRIQQIMPEPLSIEKMTLDITVDRKQLQMKTGMNALRIPASLYGGGSFEGMVFAKQYGNKPLVIDFDSDFTLAAQGDKGALTLRHFSLGDPALGSVSGQSDMILDGKGETLGALFEAGSELLVGKSRLVIEDKKLIETFLAGSAAEQTGASDETPDQSAATPDAQDVRKKYVEMLRASDAAKAARGGEALNPGLVAIRDGFYKLMEQSGTLVITVDPAQPIPFEGDPGELNAVVEFTPAQQ